ncbi:MAG: NAD-dependent epimerase/dehydratase family protein [Dehalococcoidia bacterium]
MVKKAVVLGGTGPTGPFIVDGLLERGYDVTIIHSGSHEVEFAGPVEHIHTDVHFAETLQAGLGSRTFDLAVAAYGRLRVTAEVLVGHTERLISIGGIVTARPNDPRWGPAGPQFATTEDAPVLDDPERDPFFARVAATERAVLEYHRAGHYNVTHLRYPPLLYGPRQPGARDWCIVRRVLDGRRQLIIGDGGLKVFSDGYVENAAHAVLLAIDQPEASAGRVYNVADEHPFTLRHRIDVIARVLDHQFEFVDLPYDLARPYHPFSRGRDHMVRDTSRIVAELGYHDIVPSETAIERTVRWLIEHHPEPGGELENQLGDPFDYAAEDAIIAAWGEARALMLAVPFPDYVVVHPYRHPTQPNEAWKRPERAYGHPNSTN